MISIKKDRNQIPEILLSEKKNAYQDETVLEQLKQIYHGKCAYCEQKTKSLLVEQYRPKSKYPWLENEWTNLLPVCQHCNSIKRDNFPINGKQVKIAPLDKNEYLADSETLLAELPIIIHPEIDTPENHFYYDTEGIVYGSTERGQKNIELLNLNRAFLIDKRKISIDSINNEVETIFSQNSNKEKVKELIINLLIRLDKKAEDESQELTLFNRQIFTQFGAFFYFCNSNIADVGNTLLEIHCEYLLLKYKIKNFEKIKIPFALRGFRIRNFQGIKDLQVKDIPLDTNFIFLTGENASGKTSVLRAILLGFVGDKELKQNEISQESRVELFHKNQTNMVISEFRGNNQARVSNVLGYGATRIFLSDLKENNASVVGSLFEKNTRLMNIEDKLIELDGGTKKLESLKKTIILLLKSLIPNLDDIRVEPTDTGKKVVYYEQQRKVSFNQLASGMRSIIAMIGDMVLRFWEYQPDVKNFKDFSGIVLIDEIENHLHPKWQRQFIVSLKETFKKVQFIIATHSPITILGLPKGSVILNMQRNQEDQITMVRLDDKIEYNKLLPNSLLSSDIFGLDDITGQEVENEDIETSDNYKDIEIEKRLKEKFKILKQSDADFFNSLIQPK